MAKKKTTKPKEEEKTVTPKNPVGPTIGEVLLHVGNLEGRIEILETRLSALIARLKSSKGLKGI
ncbi:hypothetical protein LCGC14_0345770 [marine sediment metagenome]|uniref:Uncharacterized protein n=1 Tax=marine sediment metagenome TaxID=412755 RepID=A0A0F9TC36_9ZZZZ